MDFEEREVGFQEADRRYAELKRQYEAGTISNEEFDEQRRRLMVRDDKGRWWAKGRAPGEWFYRDEKDWVPGTPPGYPWKDQEARGPERRTGVSISLIILLAVVMIASIAALINASQNGSKTQDEPKTQNEPETGDVKEDEGVPDTSTTATIDDGLIFADDFSETSSGWHREEFENGAMNDYVNNTYRMYVPPSWLSWAYNDSAVASGAIEDASVEVDAAVAATPNDDSDWGVVCRLRDDDNFYFMGISGDGRSFIAKREDSELDLLSSGSPSGVIREAPATNRIRGDCVGSTLTLYANGQKLLEASDAGHGSGNAGLYVRNIAMQPPATDVSFDNFSISSP